MKAAKSKRFRSVGSVLPGVLRSMKLDQVVAEQQVLRLWPDVVGEKIAQHTRALSVDRGTLKVAVDSQAWMTQLTYLKPELLRRVAGRAKKLTVKDIRFLLAAPRD